jgi:FtsP/CotA-like multicopper oxidase with cupredoxin domain
MRLLPPVLLALAVLFVPVFAQDHQHATMVTAPTPAGKIAPVGPAVLANASSQPRTVEVTLTAAPTQVSLLPGRMTAVYAYNGRVPGPTLEAREGDRVVIHFKNNLPEPTTVHWHGLHIPASSDGSPYDPIRPAASTTTCSRCSADPLARTGITRIPITLPVGQIGRGLVGTIVVRPEQDPLPAMREQLLVIADKRMTADGAIEWPDPKSLQGGIDEENGREGNVIFVNGEVAPTIAIRSGETQRWRILNASASRVVPAGARRAHVRARRQ